MSVSDKIQSRLITYAALTAVNAKRVYAVVIPQWETQSAIAHQIISTLNIEGKNTMREARLQVRCRDSNYDDAQTMAGHVQDALIAYADKTSAPYLIRATLLNRFNDFEDEQAYHMVILDFNLFYID